MGDTKDEARNHRVDRIVEVIVCQQKEKNLCQGLWVFSVGFVVLIETSRHGKWNQVSVQHCLESGTGIS